jgi:lipoprotein-anchoring transpeptidase ErfK/SrfK
MWLAFLLLTVTPARVELTPEAVNQAIADEVAPGARGPAVLRAQILLDRANFSPGEIDGYYGDNLRRAAAAFQQSRGLTADGVIRADTWAALNSDAAPALVPYVISSEDVAGPFERVPTDLMEQSKLSKLGYQSASEALGEKFHASPRLLARLNPRKPLREGQEILAPNVLTATPPRAARIVVSASNLSVEAVDAQGKVIAHYPASVGSEHDPLPVAELKINGVSKNPPFYYNPKLFWDANPSHSKAKIPPGPNNPVGVVWIDVSKEHYGIHGTPNPSTIGKTQSHGCIRLTNWDAWQLSQMVAPGTPVSLVQ